MHLISIAAKNLQRRKGKIAFVLIGLVAGVATVVSLFSLTTIMTHQAQHNMENYGANIIITPQREQLSLSYGGISLGSMAVEQQELTEASLDRIDNIPNRANISLVAPKLLGTSEANGTTVLVMGVIPEKEFLIKRWWTVQGMQIQQQTDAVLGATLARTLNLAIGDTVTTRSGDFTISGILEPTGTQDDELLILSLPVVQSMLGRPGAITLAEVAALCADCPVEDIVNQISEQLPLADVNALQQVVKSRMHALDQFRILGYAIGIIVVFIGGLIVFVTMMGAVNERTKEIGIFRALGFRRQHILMLILCEALAVSVLAGFGGYIGGSAFTALIMPLVTEMHGIAFSFNPLLLGGALLLAIATGVGASWYPAVRASRMDPNDALRML